MSAEPFSHPVLVADIPAGGRHYRLSADADERSAVAELLGIPSVESLMAEIEVRPVAGHAYSIRGTLAASVVQTDVVTLDPVSQEVAETIDVTLIPANPPSSRRKSTEVLVDAGDEDTPDVFHNGRIDLGVIVREHLALGLDPYPRAPGVDFPGHVEDDPQADPSPFAVLAKLSERGE